MPSCMAFAVAVVQGQKKLADCPHLDNNILEQLDGKVEKHKALADAHSELVFEILHLFGAQPLSGKALADQSLIIYPLPRVPFLINYWLPEDGFGSKLNILFDRFAAANSDPESIYLLTRGLVEMFRQLIVRHSRDGKLF